MPSDKKMKSMLKYLPCVASKIPQNLKMLWEAERSGLATCDESYTWTLTDKGKRFLLEDEHHGK